MTKHQLTAIVYSRRGTLIAQASNSYTKTHPLMLYFGKQVGLTKQPYLHAELAALIKCGTKQPHRIEISRTKKDGTTGLAKPCPICEQAIKAWGVKFVGYTT